MSAETFDGMALVHTLMLKNDTTEDEMKEAYKAWSKTYDKVVS